MAATVTGAFSGAGVGIGGRVNVGTRMAGAAALGVGAVRTAAGPVAPASFNLTIHLTNAGIIASRREMDNWLTESMDRLRLQGRLPLGATG
jgi:hypothetical protein